MKIVLSADLSEESWAALRWCLDHLGPGDEVFAVSGVNPLGEFVLGVPPFDSISTEHEVLRQVEATYCETLAERGVTAHVCVAPHTQARAVAEVAQREAVDLLVVGKAPHRALGDAVRNEVASHLVHHPPCPLLVVPVTAGARRR